MQRLNTPRWLVQTQDKKLYGYFTREILMCDLALNKSETVYILELQSEVPVCYAPITEASLRQEKSA